MDSPDRVGICAPRLRWGFDGQWREEGWMRNGKQGLGQGKRQEGGGDAERESHGRIARTYQAVKGFAVNGRN